MRTRRVAVVITRLEGGAGVLALRGARALDPGLFEVTLVTGRGDRLLEAARASGIRAIVDPSLRASIAPRSDVRALRRIESVLREGGFDVMHSHCAKAGAIGRLAARRAGIPRIVHTYHGFPFHEFQSPLRRRAYIAAERRLGRITDVALCVGTGVAVETVRRRLASPERIRTIGVAVHGAEGGPVSAPVTAETRRLARARLGVPADAAVIGAVGRLTYQKAPEDFVAAMRALRRPGVIGVWIGGGELAGRVERLAAASPRTPVLLAGERADVPELLPAFDVFVLPSRYEGLPTAVVEAMVCGVPVVATAVNAVGDVVVPGETGLLVPPREPGVLASAVRHLLDSPETAAMMARNARERVARYSTIALRGALEAAYSGDLPWQPPVGPGRRDAGQTALPAS